MKKFQIFRTEKLNNKFVSFSTTLLIFAIGLFFLFYICFFLNVLSPFFAVNLNANCNVTGIQFLEGDQYTGILQIEASLYNGETLLGSKTVCENTDLNTTIECTLNYPKQFDCQGTRSMIRTREDVDEIYFETMIYMFTPWLLILIVGLIVTISVFGLYKYFKNEEEKLDFKDQYFVYFDVGVEDAHNLRQIISENPFKDEMNITTNTENECVLWISHKSNSGPVYVSLFIFLLSFLIVSVVPIAFQIYLIHDRFERPETIITGVFLSLLFFIFDGLFFSLFSQRKKAIMVTDCRLIEITFRGLGYDVEYIMLNDIKDFSMNESGLLLNTLEKTIRFGDQYDDKYCEEIRDLLQQIKKE